MFHLQCIISSETCCGKNAEAAVNCPIFSTFDRFTFDALSYALEWHVQPTKAVTIKAGVCSVWVCNFSTLVSIVFGRSIDLQNLVKSNGGVP
jgi:hypothetical protein